MKILFIGNPFNFGGWSDAAVFHIRELNKLHDVTVRHINVGQGFRDISDISALCKPLEKPDLVIQHTLPDFAHRDFRIPSIIAYYSETDSIPQSWVEKINSFDSAVVSCKSSMSASINSGVKVPIHINPISVTINKDVPKEPIKINPNSCLFYTITECNNRKNLPALLMAFHKEFKPWEPVELCIKISDAEERGKPIINAMSEEIKKGLRLYPNISHYIKETIIYGYANENQISSLHKTGDIFINSSYGESFSIPTIAAGLYGNRCVVPQHSSFLDHFNRNNSFMVSCHTVPCYNTNAPSNLHKANENWWSVNINSLSNQMRAAFNSWKKQNNRVCQLVKEDLEKTTMSRWNDIV